jgi:hypothetical protein
MAYQVDRFNGQFLVSVEDGTIDTTTDLRFVGKNYAGYGEVQNENFLHLMENFSNITPPPKVVRGQIWFDSANNKIKFYDGARFKVASGAEVSSTAPTGLTTGDFWWDTTAKQLYTWTGTEFTLIGPEASPELGASTIVASVIKDTTSNPHTVLKVFADDKVVAVVSKDEFTISTTDPSSTIVDFTVIKKGITLVKSQTGVSTDDYIFWGTARDAELLGGIPANNYLQKGENEFTAEVVFNDPGFTVGDGNDLRVRVEGSENVIIENRLGNDITFRISVNELTDQRDIAVIKDTGVFPGVDNQYTLGGIKIIDSEPRLFRWNNVYATTFTGNLLGNVTGNITGAHTGNLLATDTTIMINAATKQIGYSGATLIGTLTGSVTGSASSATNASRLNDLEPLISIPALGVQSIPIRDTNGNIAANQFIGIADRSERTRINNSATDTVWNGAAANTQYRSAMTTQTAWTIAARDANADLTARIFNGTATSARYADLAEKYLADQEYETGTVVVIGGNAEVTACTVGKRAIGVVSANPAYMMNSELEGGTYIALKGRVPVKVIGSVKKGDRLTAGDNGYAVAIDDCKDVFAVALESSNDAGVKVIEALVL